MLLLSGMLLVMGFMSLSMVFTQVDRLQERTAAETRVSMLEPLGAWVDRLNVTLREAAPIGVTNVTWFLDQVQILAGRLEAEAGRQGIFLSAEVQTAPDIGIYWRNERCVAYSPDTTGGVVIGFEQETRVETIAGAVMHVKATDGKEDLESDVYLRLYECLAGRVSTWFLDAKVTEGALADEQNGQSTTDGDAAMSLTEELVTTPPDTGEPPVTNVSGHNWATPEAIGADDGATSERPGSSTDDYLVFMWDLTGYDAGTFATSVQVRIDAWHNGEIVDDRLLLVANHPTLGSVGPWEIAATTTEASYFVTPASSPSGDALWDLDELVDTEWRLYTEEGQRFDPGSKWFVEYADVVITFYTAYHSFEVSFEFPEIPSVFTEHTVWVRYQLTGGNDQGTETFDLQVWDGASWNTRLQMERLDGVWQTGSYTLLPAETTDGVLELRIVDSGSSDGLATQQDVLMIDGLWLESDIPGAP